MLSPITYELSSLNSLKEFKRMLKRQKKELNQGKGYYAPWP